MTVAAFMDLALYHTELGYYARAAQRSGRAGDFFTSVDVGPLFGDLLESQIAEMARRLTGDGRRPTADFDLVEAGAGNGRLSADIVRAMRDRDAALYDRLRLHLVEASPLARTAHAAVLGDAADRLASSSASLPSAFEGVIFANELLDAMPVHQVVMRDDGLHEAYVAVRGGDFALVEGPPSTSRLPEYLAAAGVRLEPGWRVEINLRARDWMTEVSRRLTRGFIVLIDYGHEASALYSVTHAAGTLTTFSRHAMSGSESVRPSWLVSPGEQDITAHVDFTSIRNAAEAEGLVTLGFMDQTYFLMGILESRGSIGAKDSGGLKTLLMPGGLGSTMKVLILGKNVGHPALVGCSSRMRVT